MRIGINAFGLQAAAGGVGNHVFNLLRVWPGQFSEDEIVLFCDANASRPFNDFEYKGIIHIEYLDSQDAIRDQAEKIDVYFCPAGVLWPRPLMIPCVLGLADIQERFYPQYFSSEDLKYRLFHYDWSVLMADRVITVSEFSKRSIARLIKADEKKIDRIYHCPDDLPIECERPSAFPENGFEFFAFYPGNNWEHKNHDRLLKALAIAKKRNCRIPLVLTGATVENGYAIIENAESFGVSDQVCHLGRVSRNELSWLYRNADLLTFVSEFEGFGIPIIEARSVGLPVLRGHHTSLSEVGSGADFVCDILSPDSIATRLIEAVEKGPHESDRCMEKLERRFSEATFVEAHRKTFLRAIEEFRPWRTAWKSRIQKRYWNDRREGLSDWEKAEAEKLLQEASSA